MDADTIAHVRGLERRLLGRDVRADAAALDELLHADFIEIGASGRTWTRDAIVAALLADPDPGPLDVADLDAIVIGPDAVIITYETTRPERRVLRSSLWIRSDGRWQIVFHQGTIDGSR